jgi:hypothetical protein
MPHFGFAGRTSTITRIDVRFVHLQADALQQRASYSFTERP